MMVTAGLEQRRARTAPGVQEEVESMDAADITGIQYGERWGGDTSPTYALAQIPPESRAQANGVFKAWALVREGRQGMIAEPHNSFASQDEAREWLRTQGLQPL